MSKLGILITNIIKKTYTNQGWSSHVWVELQFGSTDVRVELPINSKQSNQTNQKLETKLKGQFQISSSFNQV